MDGHIDHYRKDAKHNDNANEPPAVLLKPLALSLTEHALGIPVIHSLEPRVSRYFDYVCKDLKISFREFIPRRQCLI